jgi:tetratricopeptide (TPR) repeat protein
MGFADHDDPLRCRTLRVTSRIISKGPQVANERIPATPGTSTVAGQFAAALRLHNDGAFDQAAVLYSAIVALEPQHFDALHMLGLLASQTGKFLTTVDFLERAIAVNPRSASAHFNLANALKVLRRFEVAVGSYDAVILINPGYAGAEYNRAMALSELHQHESAVLGFERAIVLKPESILAYLQCGHALQHLQRYALATQMYDDVIRLSPDNYVAHSNKGSCLYQLHDFAGALLSFDVSIALHPQSRETHYNRGNTLVELGQHERATQSYDHALAISADYPKAQYGRGNALFGLKKYYAASDSYRQALDLQPDYAQAAANLGNAQRELKLFDSAMDSYATALAMHPELAIVHWNRSLLMLLTGDLAAGWLEYEWRWQHKRAEIDGRDFQSPLWLGHESLEGKSILLHSEQGLGDTIQFCRFASAVQTLGAQVTLEVPQSLMGLLEHVEGVHTLVANGRASQAFDFHCPLMSLPLALGTRLDSIPAGTRYLRCDSKRLAQWQQRLGPRTRPRIGLVWSGSIHNTNDANRNVDLWELLRSLPGGFDYVCLQKEIRECDQAALQCHKGVLVFASDLHDFSDTAALCEAMDLIISVDTSVAHLAGALDKKLFVLLPFVPDWRWLLERSDSPWYKNATLFRQDTAGSWDKALHDVAQAVKDQDLLGQNFHTALV